MYNFSDPRTGQNSRLRKDRQDFFPTLSNSLFFDPFSAQTQEGGRGPEEESEDYHADHPFYTSSSASLQKQRQVQLQQQ
ncbi:hypothetical protein BGX23_012357, partial [Mortierella sp. AD031]